MSELRELDVPEAWLMRSGTALRNAKDEGRNRVNVMGALKEKLSAVGTRVAA